MNETEREFRQVFEKISTDLNRIATVLENGWKAIEWIIPLAVLFGLIVFAVSAVKAVVRWQQVSAGTHCIVAKDEVFGVTELQDKAELEKALKIKDETGVQDMIAREKALSLPKGTTCLVLDSTAASDSDSRDFFPKDLFDFSFYRRIRILSGDYHGKAAWVPNSVLQTGQDYPQHAQKSPQDAKTMNVWGQGEFILDMRERKPGEPVPQKIISDADKQSILQAAREAILRLHPGTNIGSKDYFIKVMPEWYEVELPVVYRSVTYGPAAKCIVRKAGQRCAGELISFPAGTAVDEMFDAFITAKHHFFSLHSDYKDSLMGAYNPESVTKLGAGQYRVILKYDSKPIQCEVDDQSAAKCSP
jgi:hypothetical protein